MPDTRKRRAQVAAVWWLVCQLAWWVPAAPAPLVLRGTAVEAQAEGTMCTCVSELIGVELHPATDRFAVPDSPPPRA